MGYTSLEIGIVAAVKGSGYSATTALNNYILGNATEIHQCSSFSRRKNWVYNQNKNLAGGIYYVRCCTVDL